MLKFGGVPRVHFVCFYERVIKSESMRVLIIDRNFKQEMVFRLTDPCFFPSAREEIRPLFQRARAPMSGLGVTIKRSADDVEGVCKCSPSVQRRFAQFDDWNGVGVMSERPTAWQGFVAEPEMFGVRQ